MGLTASLHLLAGLGALGLGAGIGIGLLVSWIVWPVEYTDVAPDSLHPLHREEYIVLIGQIPAPTFKEKKRIRYSPAGISIHVDISFVFCW